MSTIETRELGEREGFTLTVHLEPDMDSSPYDVDCYDEEDLQAWKDGRWTYVGVVVMASRAGIELGEASIWGTEMGYGSWEGYCDPFENGYHTDLADEAIILAKAKLAKLCAEV